ncbi:hypothetical protein BKA62DRAFT_829703 [Auriculariales sp. MPI-PUGE-AT-0066]|nr:hypothetical protein BKA62DRAFT_829703 [Auriculariales sp. MPI-PUGE-AT-0066]
MVNWNDPHVLALSIRAYALFAHMLAGLWLWEFIVTFDFDWQIIRGKRPRNLGALLYLLPRYSCMATAIVAVRITNAIGPLDCMGWNYAQHAWAYITISFASALLYARVWALTEGNPWVVGGLGILYVGNWGMVVYGVYFSRGEWFEKSYVCAAVLLTHHRWNAIYQLVFDMLCLGVMLFVLIRMHHGGSLWRLLVQQGLLYFLAITFLFALHLTFLSLPLNPAVSQIPSALRVVGVTIAVTRMQRGLIDFVQNRPVVTSSGGAGTFSRDGTTLAVPSAAKRKGYPPTTTYPSPNATHGSVQINVNVDTWGEDQRKAQLDDDHEVFPMNKMDSGIHRRQNMV